MSQKPVLLLQTGDTPPFIDQRCGNFDAMFFAAAGLDSLPVSLVHAARGGHPEPPSRYRAAIITGSHAMVTDGETWSLELEAWIGDAADAELPVFGVCYGHQLMARTLGGAVGYHPGGDETGTFDIELTEEGAADPFLAGLPDRFGVNLSHSQTVTSLPPGAAMLARSTHDPYQILRYAPHLLSVQFHPEFGAREMAAYLAYRAFTHPAGKDGAVQPARETGGAWVAEKISRYGQRCRRRVTAPCPEPLRITDTRWVVFRWLMRFALTKMKEGCPESFPGIFRKGIP